MRKKICVLEDNKDIREVIEMFFLSEDYEVLCFSTVGELLANKNSLRPDVFLLDVMLPDGNGIDVCRKLSCLKATASIPVLMMSATADLKQISANCPAVGFVAKPFDLSSMLNAVNLAVKA
ncbi:MAG: response regulator [Pedobacter sp.]|nr:MAG: response regulator [Pedobacter sp.]